MVRTQAGQQLASEEFVFAITSVSAATAAAKGHGDLQSAAILADYYALVAETINRSNGRVVKVIGDGVLLVFPIRRAKTAVEDLHTVQTVGTKLWSAFDNRCRVQVRAGAGSLAAGPMGPPGEQRFDVYGSALNELFKAPVADFTVTPSLQGLLE